MKTENKTNLLLEQKYKAKEKAAENGDFKTFSLISQDIRQIERELKQKKK
jgi:hypothetical protein